MELMIDCCNYGDRVCSLLTLLLATLSLLGDTLVLAHRHGCRFAHLRLWLKEMGRGSGVAS